MPVSVGMGLPRPLLAAIALLRDGLRAHAGEHRELPGQMRVMDAQDVEPAVVALDLDVAVIRPEPLIDGVDHLDVPRAELETLRHDHAAMSQIGIDTDLHAARLADFSQFINRGCGPLSDTRRRRARQTQATRA